MTIIEAIDELKIHLKFEEQMPPSKMSHVSTINFYNKKVDALRMGISALEKEQVIANRMARHLAKYQK